MIEFGPIKTAKFRGDPDVRGGIREKGIAKIRDSEAVNIGTRWVEATRVWKKLPLLKGYYSVNVVTRWKNADTTQVDHLVDCGRFRTVRAAVKAGMQEYASSKPKITQIRP